MRDNLLGEGNVEVVDDLASQLNEADVYLLLLGDHSVGRVLVIIVVICRSLSVFL